MGLTDWTCSGCGVKGHRKSTNLEKCAWGEDKLLDWGKKPAKLKWYVCPGSAEYCLCLCPRVRGLADATGWLVAAATARSARSGATGARRGTHASQRGGGGTAPRTSTRQSSRLKQPGSC